MVGSAGWIIPSPCIRTSNDLALRLHGGADPRHYDGRAPFLDDHAYLPLSLPVLATVSLFVIVTTWNEYLHGLIFIRDPEKMPLQTYLQSIFIKIDPSHMTSEEIIEASKVSNTTLNAAKIIVSLVPIVAIYPFLQRYFIHGIMLGSVKE